MQQESDRTRELRRELVQAASRPTTSRRRLAFATVGAFALGVALTGGVSAAAFSQLDAPDSSYEAATALWVASMARPNAEVLSEVSHLDGDQGGPIDPGAAPDHATSLAVAVSCDGDGALRILLDGEFEFSSECASGAGGGGTSWPVQRVGSGEFSVELTGSATFDVWMVWVAEPPVPVTSAQQLQEISDGVATREEYVAGFTRFADCMGAEGYPVSPAFPDATVFEYVIPGEAVWSGVDERCYNSEFMHVDMLWQVAHENVADKRAPYASE